MNKEKKTQQAQYMRWWRWKMKEGGVHKATHSTTYQEESQKERIKWLVNKCSNTSDILEIGCSGGYIIEKVKGKYGMDIEKEIIESNRKRNNKIKWLHHDARKIWPFKDESIEIVLLPDILEHINYTDALFLIKEAIRVGKKVLITIPNGLKINENERNWACFKHKWVLTEEKLRELSLWISRQKRVGKVEISKNDAFIYFDIEIRDKSFRKSKGE